MIVLDTSVLSQAFRRRLPTELAPREAAEMQRLIEEDVPMCVPGIVLQELLSGVRGPAQFHKLQVAMQGFPILLATEFHHVRAAKILNACRSRGITCSTVDALIAAMCVEIGGVLFTADVDFRRIAPCCGLRLYVLRA
jgi:predicted nucleic acid-binding protein